VRDGYPYVGLAGLVHALKWIEGRHQTRNLPVDLGWGDERRTATPAELYRAGITGDLVLDCFHRQEVIAAAAGGILDGIWSPAMVRWAITVLGGPAFSDSHRAWLGLPDDAPSRVRDLMEGAISLGLEGRDEPAHVVPGFFHPYRLRVLEQVAPTRPGGPRLRNPRGEELGRVIVDTVRLMETTETAVWWRAWNSDPDGYAAGRRYAAYLERWLAAGVSPAEATRAVGLPLGHPERHSAKALDAMTALLTLGRS
jgi:hypothetical protein